MPTPAKEATIAGLVEALGTAQAAILADYRGLTVEELTRLRRRLLPLNARFTVTKNTLLRRALDGAGKPDLGDLLEGPSAVLFADGDPAEATKVMLAFARELRRDLPHPKGGLLGARVLSAAEVNDLATMPPREQILANFLGTVQSPAAGLVSTLGAILQNLVATVEAYQAKQAGTAA